MGDISKHLNKFEIACKCGCGLASMDSEILKIFDKIRDIHGKPLIINSGCRCKKHNAAVGGKETSAHLPDENGKCHALDIQCANSHDRFDIIHLAVSFGISRIGIHKSFIHIDTRRELPQEVLWLY